MDNEKPEHEVAPDQLSDAVDTAELMSTSEEPVAEIIPTDETAIEIGGEEMPITDEGIAFDESELLKLAQQEGLAETLEEVSPEEADKPLDLSAEEQASIMAGIETVLFMSDKPVSLPKLRSIINPEVPLSAYRSLMAQLREESGREHRGVDIAEVAMGFQLRTKPHMTPVLRKMVKTQPVKFSPASIEVLSIVAYKQPTTKDDLDKIRGVDCGYILRALMEKRLIRILGRSDLPGRPILYGTSHEFLELFSLRDAKALPPLHEVEAMVAASEVGVEEQQAEKFNEFSKMVASSDKILFDDSKIDSELEELRNEIAAIPTSTAFIEEQKAQEKRSARIIELAALGMTLDENDNVIPIGGVPASDEIYVPSPELEAAAAAAQWERHTAMIAQVVAESEIAGQNVQAISEANAQALEQSLTETAPDVQSPEQQPEKELEPAPEA